MPATNWCFPVQRLSGVSAVPPRGHTNTRSSVQTPACVKWGAIGSLTLVMAVSRLFKSENVYTKDCGLID